MFVQATLSRRCLHTVAWIKKKKGVAVGARVFMKEFGEFWDIDALGNEKHDIEIAAMEINRRAFGSSIKKIDKK
jgi:hypothetical protein